MPNQTVNKVEFGGQTVMDITDTTADAADVIEGEVFYTKSGARSVGTLTDATQSAHGLMSTSDKIKLDGIDLLGVKLNSTALLPDANGYVNIPVMTGATSSAAGATGLVPAPTSADYDKFLRGDGTWQDGGKPMVILSYGNSTWNDFITAYNNHVIVYCRASSNSNPASGSQTRMAFMAYVNDATSPTNVEFQYYRSMNAHSATAMGDEVYVYKLTNAGAWSVTVRKASVKEVAVSGGGLSASWASDKVTFTTSNATTSADGMMSSTDKTKLDGIATGATKVENFQVSVYDIPAAKGVAIQYSDQVPVLISVQRSNTGGRLLLLGGGYGDEAWIRNDFVEVLHGDKFEWCLSDTSRTIEIMQTQTINSAKVVVWSNATVTFTEINSLSKTADTTHVIAYKSPLEQLLASQIFTPGTGIVIHEDRYCYKIGRTVTLCFSLKKSDGTAFTSDRTILGTFINGWYPISNQIFPLSGNRVLNSYVDTIAGNLLFFGNQLNLDKTTDNTGAQQLQICATFISNA